MFLRSHKFKTIIRKFTFLLLGSQWKICENQPKLEDYMGLSIVFYTINLHEIKRKCNLKLTFIIKNIVNR